MERWDEGRGAKAAVRPLLRGLTDRGMRGRGDKETKGRKSDGTRERGSDGRGTRGEVKIAVRPLLRGLTDRGMRGKRRRGDKETGRGVEEFWIDDFGFQITDHRLPITDY